MPGTASVTELLSGTLRDVERVSRIGTPNGGAIAAEIERELQQAQSILARILRAEARRHGGLDARFTGASALSYERQVRLSIEYMKARLAGLTEAQARVAIDASMQRTITLMEGLEQRFTGIHRPLQLRQADQLRSATRGAQASLLRQMPTSVDRYGAAMIGEMEGMIRVGLTMGASMDDMIGWFTGHGGPKGKVSLRATVTPSGVVRLEEADIPEGLFERKRYWAERIVRTEVLRAYNGARQEAFEAIRATDFPDLKKKIVAILDSRTAEDSIAVNGQVRGLGELFVDGAGRQYLYPPARPNDRETTIPWRDEWGGAASRARPSEKRALGDISRQAEQTIVTAAQRAQKRQQR
ncbi:MAG: Phage Mu protein like protein, partial [Planctomycetota bacterium]